MMYSFKSCDAHYRRLDWSLTFECNYTCPYCFIRESCKEQGQETILAHSYKELSDRITYLFVNRVDYIEMSGGEPLILKSIPDIVEKLAQSFFIGLNSNMSLTSLTTLLKISPRLLHRVNCSYHLTEIGSLSESSFKDSLFDLVERSYPVRVICVAYPPVFEQMLEVFRYFYSSGVPAEFRPYRGIYNGSIYPYEYCQKHKDVLSEHNRDRWCLEMIASSSPVSYRGVKCNAGKYSYYLSTKGELYRCVTDANMKEHQSLGHIISMDVLPNEARICEHEHCLCPYHGSLYAKGGSV